MTDVLNPPSKEVPFSGKTITVTPVRMGKLQAFTAAVRPIAADIMEAVQGSGDLLATIELHADRMIEAVTIGTGIDRAEIEDAMPDEFLLLAAAVIEVNTDFFVRRLLPSLSQSVAGLAQTIKTVKQMPG